MNMDIPIGLVYQSEEYKKYNYCIIFEQFFKAQESQVESRTQNSTEGVSRSSCGIDEAEHFQNLTLRDEESKQESEESLDSSYDSDLKDTEKHIIFLLHGYRSDPEDLNKILWAIRIKSPATSIHCIESIESKQELGILQLGEIVAQE